MLAAAAAWAFIISITSLGALCAAAQQQAQRVDIAGREEGGEIRTHVRSAASAEGGVRASEAAHKTAVRSWATGRGPSPWRMAQDDEDRLYVLHPDK
eukprot:3352735-Prymnesium_polylepis.1